MAQVGWTVIIRMIITKAEIATIQTIGGTTIITATTAIISIMIEDTTDREVILPGKGLVEDTKDPQVTRFLQVGDQEEV